MNRTIAVGIGGAVTVGILLSADALAAPRPSAFAPDTVESGTVVMVREIGPGDGNATLVGVSCLAGEDLRRVPACQHE